MSIFGGLSPFKIYIGSNQETMITDSLLVKQIRDKINPLIKFCVFESNYSSWCLVRGAVALKTTANVLARGEHSHINRTRLLVGNLEKKTLFCGRGLNFLLGGYQKRVLTHKECKGHLRHFCMSSPHGAVRELRTPRDSFCYIYRLRILCGS